MVHANKAFKVPGTMTVCAVQDELAEQTLKAMCRKFSESAKIWLRHISWLLSKDRADAARKVLDKSFAALPKRKHVKVLLQKQVASSHCVLASGT